MNAAEAGEQIGGVLPSPGGETGGAARQAAPPPRVGSLFTGYAGLDLAVEEHFDASTVWCSDIDPGACKILAHRAPGIPNLGDITAVDWAAVGPVDILCGGWPCQPFSFAGKRKGAADERALWPFVAGAVRALRPRHVVLENVAAIATAGELARACADLSALGYDAQWRCLRAADVGAPHGRARIFITADARSAGLEGPASHRQTPAQGRQWTGQNANGFLAGGHRDIASTHPDSHGLQSFGRLVRRDPDRRSGAHVAWGAYEPAIRRWERILGREAPAPTETSPKGSQRLSPRFVEWMMGLPAGWVCDVPGLTRNEQLKALGNGVVPQQALAALRIMANLERAA